MSRWDLLGIEILQMRYKRNLSKNKEESHRLGNSVLPFQLADPCNPLKIAEALMEGGIGALEITYGVRSSIRLTAIRKEFPDLLLGAGSLTEADQIN